MRGRGKKLFLPKTMPFELHTGTYSPLKGQQTGRGHCFAEPWRGKSGTKGKHWDPKREILTLPRRLIMIKPAFRGNQKKPSSPKGNVGKLGGKRGPARGEGPKQSSEKKKKASGGRRCWEKNRGKLRRNRHLVGRGQGKVPRARGNRKVERTGVVVGSEKKADFPVQSKKATTEVETSLLTGVEPNTPTTRLKGETGDGAGGKGGQKQKGGPDFARLRSDGARMGGLRPY